MHLYELLPAFKKLEQLSENNEEMTVYLDSAKLTLDEKVNNIVKVERGMNLDVDMLDTEIKRLSELKRIYENRKRNLRNYVANQMLVNDIKEIKTDIARLSFRKSTQLEIIDGAEIPEKFKTRKEVVSIDKMAIKKAIEKGEQVDGASVKTFNNLQIK